MWLGIVSDVCFFIFRGRPRRKDWNHSSLGGYLVKPVFQVAAGMWTCKAHGHSPTQRGQKADRGCLWGCRKLLQQPGLPGCASPAPRALSCCKGQPSVQIAGVVLQVCPQPNAPKCQPVARPAQLLCKQLISDLGAVWEPYFLFMSRLIALLWVLRPWASFHSSSISSLWAPKLSSGICHELKWKCLSVNTATMKYVHLSTWGLGLWAWWPKATLIQIWPLVWQSVFLLSLTKNSSIFHRSIGIFLIVAKRCRWMFILSTEDNLQAPDSKQLQAVVVFFNSLAHKVW